MVEKTSDPLAPQIVFAAPEAVLDVNLHRAFGKTQPGGHFALGEQLQTPEDEDLAAARGQLVNRIGEDINFFPSADYLRGTRPPIEDGQDRQIPYWVDGGGTAASDEIEGEMTGSLEEESLGRVNGLCGATP
jgi:hypothetical protein